MMSRGKSTTRKSSTSNATSKNKFTNKNQLPSDTVYLMQNQNEILKLKNKQLSYRIDALNTEVKQRKLRIVQKQNQCQQIRHSISQTIYLKDIELENQKQILLNKLTLTNQKMSSIENKIKDLRTQVIVEQDRIPVLISQGKKLQQQLRILKMENQGLKKVLINLEEQNQQFRQKNNQLSIKKYSKEPQQRIISEQIEQRIRLIKNLNVTQKSFKKQKSVQLILKILENLFYQRKKICFLTTQRHGLKKSLIKKRLFMLTLIRKNYLNSVKNRVMSIFRQPLSPLPQQEKCVRILQDMRKRREKAKIWRIWRNQTVKAEYSLIRKYEGQTVIQKIGKTMLKCSVINAFNKIRCFGDNHRKNIAASKVYTIISNAINKPIKGFFSFLQRDNNSFQIQQQIQNSASQQSRSLVMSKIFYAWVACMKEKKKDSLTLKFKYFKKLKKIFVFKKRNVLSQMLGETKIRINQIYIKSVCFAAIKKQLFSIKDQRVIQEKQRLNNTQRDLREDTENRLILDEQIDKRQALFKVQKYLQRKVKKAFTIWRKQNKRIYAVQRILSLMSLFTQQSVNYAFSRIQIRRFEKLKLSIKDKIASCDYSYNYLVQENTHIKEVLDKKSHQLEKAKFTSILERLIRRQKQIKHKYFYKFLKNGFKCWKVKKSLQNIDYLMKKKLSQVLFFLLKINKTEKIQLQKIQYFTEKKDNKLIKQLIQNSIKGFELNSERNKRMRRAMGGVFDRNMELNFYQAFGKMRNQFYQYEQHQIQNHQNQLQQQIKNTDLSILDTQKTIEILEQRLKTKQQIFRERKTMSIYKFFAKNVKKGVGIYIKKWKNKVDEQKRIMSFVKNLQRKTEYIVKMRLLFAVQKTKQQLYQKQLQHKLIKYTDEYEHANEYFDKFITNTEERIATIEIQNEKNDEIVQQYEKKIDNINKVKVESFQRHWGKNICKFVFREWKNQKIKLVQKLNVVFRVLNRFGVREPFKSLSQQIRQGMYRERIRKNLSKAMTKKYRYNTGMYFKIWRNVNINKKVQQSEQSLKQAMKGMQHIEDHLKDVKKRYNNEVNHRIISWKLRRITNQWRIYTEKKLSNSKKQLQLSKWLQIGYTAQFIQILHKHKQKQQKQRNIVNTFQQKNIQNKAAAFIKHIYKIKNSKNTIQRLFINKFCFHKIYELKQQFITKTKNYQRFKEIQSKDQKTRNILKVINTFEKKRKGILCQNMRTWKRNMFLMQIEKNLLKRVVKNAMNNRVKDLFYAWKLQAQARNMVRQHTEEGQVKKRKVQIKRLKKFIDDYKKQKGLLLENEEGDFVVSPRFQQNKENQIKRQNLLKYKFVSRLILSMNGYEGPVKAWTNLQTFTKLRVKCQKLANIVKNRMQKGDLYTSFKIWQKDARQIRKNFQEMERKDLIRLLNRQKDRMQIEYGKKIEVEEKVERQLRRYKLLSYQEKRKERIFAQILFRQSRKVKSFAFDTWRKRAEQCRDYELHDLEQRGNNKLLTMEQQVQDLQQYYFDVENNNRMLKQAVQQALELADMIKRISEERDQLQRQLSESDISCENLQQQNEELNNKLILAQKQAMNLLSLSNKGL